MKSIECFSCLFENDDDVKEKTTEKQNKTRKSELSFVFCIEETI